MTRDERDRWGYIIVWEFRPWKGAEARFEETYGPRGYGRDFSSAETGLSAQS
jgi:hypothetical protein